MNTPTTDIADDLEAIDTPTDSLASYPIDSLFIRTEPRTIQDVLRRIHQRAISLDPDFQREFVWDISRQSRLVESVLMRIPLPVFYFAENRDGTLVVVDGLQRLSTFRRFHNGELVLDLPRSEVNGLRFGQLPPKLQNRFEDGPLTLYLIDAKVPDRVRLDIFERVNSGIMLTRQQMRNALYNGPATRLLTTLATSAEFQSATAGALSVDRHRKSMRDREAVNRYVAFRLLGWQSYGQRDETYDDFLGRGLAAANEPSQDLDLLANQFLASMRRNAQIFREHAFRKSAPGEKRSTLNLALFDVFSVLLSTLPGELRPDQAEAVKKRTERLLKHDSFRNAISYATAAPASVHERFRLAERLFQES